MSNSSVRSTEQSLRAPNLFSIPGSIRPLSPFSQFYEIGVTGNGPERLAIEKKSVTQAESLLLPERFTAPVRACESGSLSQGFISLAARFASLSRVDSPILFRSVTREGVHELEISKIAFVIK